MLSVHRKPSVLAASLVDLSKTVVGEIDQGSSVTSRAPYSVLRQINLVYWERLGGSRRSKEHARALGSLELVSFGFITCIFERRSMPRSPCGRLQRAWRVARVKAKTGGNGALLEATALAVYNVSSHALRKTNVFGLIRGGET